MTCDVHACVCQDPVYGKGKLAEIQGLILGMLDTFNYEQVKNRMDVCVQLLRLKLKCDRTSVGSDVADFYLKTASKLLSLFHRFPEVVAQKQNY